ncbi:DUF1932 domain-containing protein [Shouchella lehensis]|uniref:NAD(P)-dependent oxidoreductase n=1 Tax=Shouchella lehensis TaxID=300825 RepID=A0A4Y7WDX1_9BACI|nr:DUF1932 domain-containing protein [Shouchella lehensis]MBG9784743.1 3-hydroxyisobutyrate dehydrogenase [Shouchella lehensis]TES46145.1 NAD(P)-dependent oxidoreductase [Shouchella lehensis]
MRIGFIGYGEASFELSRGLRDEGLEHIKAYDVMVGHEDFGPKILQRAQEAGVFLKNSIAEVVSDLDVLFVAVPANKALDVSVEITSFLEESNLIYVDVSAATPKVKQDISKGLEKVDITFVDVAMLGPLPVYKHKVPIMASGTGTLYLIEKMTPLNMSIDYVGENPGEASAVKLVRSIFMKGIVGLYVEMLEASETFNVSEKVLTSLEETMDTHTFMNTLNRLVAGSAVHAKRRGIELEGSIEMLKEAGLEATMSTAARDRFEKLANLNADIWESAPTNWKDVLSKIHVSE